MDYQILKNADQLHLLLDRLQTYEKRYFESSMDLAVAKAVGNDAVAKDIQSRLDEMGISIQVVKDKLMQISDDKER